jgi:hypothetical protein
MTRQRDELDPMAAMAGTYAAMLEAARYSGAGMRTASRRATRRARGLAKTYSGRSVDAFQVMRGAPPRPDPRPRVGAVVAMAVVAGAGGAVTALGIRRIVADGRARRGQVEVADTLAGPAHAEPASAEPAPPSARPGSAGSA